jgi:hypothetical protein
MNIPQQEVNDGKNHDKSKASASPFPAGIARYQCLEPILHILFLNSFKKLCQYNLNQESKAVI